MAQSVKVCGVDVDREEKVSGIEKCVVMRHQPWPLSELIIFYRTNFIVRFAESSTKQRID